MTTCGLCSHGLSMSGGSVGRSNGQKKSGERLLEKSVGKKKVFKKSVKKTSQLVDSKAADFVHVKKKLVKGGTNTNTEDSSTRIRNVYSRPNGQYNQARPSSSEGTGPKLGSNSNAYARQIRAEKDNDSAPTAPTAPSAPLRPLFPSASNAYNAKSSGWKTSEDGIQWALRGPAGNQGLEFLLTYGQEVAADRSAMIFMDGDVKSRTEVVSRTIIPKAPSANQSIDFHMTYFTGNKSGSAQRLFLGDGVMGDIVCITMDGQTFLNNADRKVSKIKWALAAGTFLAGTKNIKVVGIVNNIGGVKGVGSSNTLSVVMIEAGDDKAATLWVNGHGLVTRHDVKQGESLVVKADAFLACKSTTKYIAIAGATGYSSSNIMLKFEGPGIVYTSSKTKK